MALCKYGISSIVSDAQCGAGVHSLDFIEYRSSLPLLPDEGALRAIGDEPSRIASIRLETSDRMAFDPKLLASAKWEYFAHLLYESVQSKQVLLTLALSKSTIFSTSLFDQIRICSELLYPVTIMIDASHRSWFRPEVTDLLDDADVPLVMSDTPPLPGLTHPDPSTHASLGYIRLLGRNIREWCSPELRKRYEYRYERYELEEIRRRVHTLCMIREQIFVVAATTVPTSALSAIRYLQQSQQTMPKR